MMKQVLKTVDNVTYHHLILDQNGTKTAGGNLDIDGNLTISNSAVLDMDDANNRTLDLEGDFTIASSGNFTARAGSHDIFGNGMVLVVHFSLRLREL